MHNYKRPFKPQYNRTISLQDCKLHRKSDEYEREWMGTLWTKAVECEYKEYNRLLTEHSISRINDDGIIDENLREVATLEDIEDMQMCADMDT